MSKIGKFFHMLNHKIGNNRGEVVTWWAGRKLMVGFKCDGCKKISVVYETRITRGGA